MNKKQLLALIASREARKAEIGAAIEKATEVVELRSLQKELNDINGEIANYRSIADGMPDEAEPTTPSAPPVAPGTEAQAAQY